MKIQLALLTVAALCGSGAVGAQSASTMNTQDRGWYLGADVGASKGPDGGDINGSVGIPASGTSVDDNDTAWGLHLGYRINRNWAVEGGWRRLGKFDYGTSSGAVNAAGEYKVDAWSLAGVGMLPLGQGNWSLFGKLGVARTETDRTVGSASPGFTGSSASANRTGLLGGIGINYDFSRSAYTRLGWDHYDRVGNDSTGKTDIDVVSLGVGWRF